MTQQLLVHQQAGQVRRVGEMVYYEGDPFVILEVKPKREEGVFIDFGSIVESRVVVLSVERYDETKEAS